MGKATAGRKKIINVKRTASGQRSRAKGAYQENADAILTRMRLFGLSEKDARDQKAATFIGRLQLTKAISAAQYDAAVRYQEVVAEYRRAISAPEGLRSTEGTGGAGADTDSHAAWCRGAIRRREDADEAVRTEQVVQWNRANLFAALDYVVLRDEQVWHMVGDARLALNALAHHFGLEKRIAA